jgi:DNA topoisomerase-1
LTPGEPEEKDKSDEDEDAVSGGLPPLTEGERLELKALRPEQKFTQPPPRYSEATLVKELEENGIGRPSTYASIIGVLQDRDYVNKIEGKFKPTALGLIIVDLLTKSFDDIVDVEYTRNLEEDLDKIEAGKTDYVRTLSEFYKKFKKDLARADKEMQNLKEGIKTDEVCDRCGSPMLIKVGKFGPFVACSGYPECTNTRELEKAEDSENGEEEIEPCENCGKPMAVKRGRFGQFLACSGYPECKTTRPITIGIPCPQDGCGGELTERRSKRGKPYYGCANYPTCKFVVWQRPVAAPCPKCGAPFLLARAARGKRHLACWREGCDYRREADDA